MPSDDDQGHPASDWGWVEVVRRHYDPESDFDLTSVLVSAVADAAGVEPAALDGPPLYESVDATALESTLFEGEGASDCSVDFRYLDYRVVVDGDGRIRVYERADPSD
jgi:hypothetical protein